MSNQYVVSVYNSESRRAVNRLRHKNIAKWLEIQGVKFEEGVGRTKNWGIERCFILENRQLALGLASTYEQDAVLVILPSGTARLTGSSKSLGKWVKTPRRRGIDLTVTKRHVYTIE